MKPVLCTLCFVSFLFVSLNAEEKITYVELPEHTGGIRAMAFSPDGKKIVTIDDENIRIWNVESGKLLHAWPTHTMGMHTAAVSSDGLRVATASKEDSTVRIWDVTAFSLEIKPHTPASPPSVPANPTPSEKEEATKSRLDLPPDANEEAELTALREQILAQERAQELALIEEERKIIPLVDDPDKLIPLDPVDRIWITADRKKVVLLGRVVFREGFLELLACRVRSKEHESILSIRVKPHVVHAALLAVNARPGHPVQFSPAFVPASGDRIDITLRWQTSHRSSSGAGEVKTHESPAQDWIWDMSNSREGEKRAMQTHWVFSGSRTYRDAAGNSRYLADETGELFGLSNFVGSILDVPIQSSADNTQLLFGCFTERIPPIDTPVTIILTPNTH